MLVVVPGFEVGADTPLRAIIQTKEFPCTIWYDQPFGVLAAGIWQRVRRPTTPTRDSVVGRLTSHDDESNPQSACQKKDMCI